MDIEIGSNLKNLLEQVLLATVAVSGFVIFIADRLVERVAKLWLDHKKPKEEKKKDE